MILNVEKSHLEGRVRIPGSKSHTIRAVAIGSMANGTSRILDPLVSDDALSAIEIYRGFDAEIEIGKEWKITGGRPQVPNDVLNVGNSGTSLYIAVGTAALADGHTVLTGDHQIRRRPAQALLDSLNMLGARGFSTRDNGCPPLVIQGPMQGGRTHIDGSKTSQYLTSLLLNCPLAESDTEITVTNACEKPYIEMTLAWLNEQGIRYEREGFERFFVPGRQSYKPFEKSIPGDFSSATFFLCAAAVTGSELVLQGLDMNDTQGDKAVVNMLAEMGGEVEQLPEGIRIKGGQIKGGCEFDLADTPDALPALAVTACFAQGTNRLVNVAQARLKETDRIKVMAEELAKMGGKVKELPDGLEIEGTQLHGAKVCGHDDHRVVMALAVAGLACEGKTEIDSAEAVDITFPDFVGLMTSVGAVMKLADTITL